MYESVDPETRRNRHLMIKKLRELNNYSSWNANHSIHVARIARDFAKYLNLDPNTLANIAITHDVGKTTIPHKILHKPGKLTPDEKTVMDTHVTGGIEQLNKLTGEYGKIARLGALYHHLTPSEVDELVKQKILTPLESTFIKILTIVDIFDALVDKGRPYKEGKSKQTALEIMETDPHIDNTLFKKFKQWQLENFKNEYR